MESMGKHSQTTYTVGEKITTGKYYHGKKLPREKIITVLGPGKLIITAELMRGNGRNSTPTEAVAMWGSTHIIKCFIHFNLLCWCHDGFSSPCLGLKKSQVLLIIGQPSTGGLLWNFVFSSCSWITHMACIHSHLANFLRGVLHAMFSQSRHRSNMVFHVSANRNDNWHYMYVYPPITTHGEGMDEWENKLRISNSGKKLPREKLSRFRGFRDNFFPL